MNVVEALELRVKQLEAEVKVLRTANEMWALSSGMEDKPSAEVQTSPAGQGPNRATERGLGNES